MSRGGVVRSGNNMTKRLLKMQLLEDDDELAYLAPTSGEEEEEEKKERDGRPSWMKNLHNSISNWMTVIPEVSGHDASTVRDVAFDCRKPAARGQNLACGAFSSGPHGRVNKSD